MTIDKIIKLKNGLTDIKKGSIGSLFVFVRV